MSVQGWLGAIAWLALTLGMGTTLSSAYAAEKTPDDLVLVQPGTMPIILTAPHGGRQAIPGLEERNANDKNKTAALQRWGGFVAGGGDLNTDILAEGMAAEIRKLTGRMPYVVVAKFVRKYVDANRPENLAFDDERARPYYEYYHASIRRFVDEIRAKYSGGLLIDVHGQGKQPDVIMRGTQNGKTVRSLVARRGMSSVIGPNGIFGQLEANGFKIFPDNTVPPSGTNEDAGLNGGFTTVIYGAQTAGGIDAVQFEFGSNYRTKDSVANSARNAGKAIAAFYDAYLKALPN